MYKKYTGIILFISFFCASLPSTAFDLHITDKSIANAGEELRKTVDHLKKNLPELVRKTSPAIADELNKKAPEVIKQAEGFVDNVTIKIKSIPVAALGFTGGVISLIFLKKTIESYLEKLKTNETVEKKVSTKRELITIAASTVVLVGSLATLFKSEPITRYFAG